MVKHKLARPKTGSIQAHNVRGRATNLVQVRAVETGSAEASAGTVRQRSKFANVWKLCAALEKMTMNQLRMLPNKERHY